MSPVSINDSISERARKLEKCEHFVLKLVEQGGPSEPDYPLLDACTREVQTLAAQGVFSPADIAKFREAFGDALSLATLQGFTFLKPHGYAGDYEIIDLIYRQHISSDSRYANWDRYYHYLTASRAVRNRKSYFHGLLDCHYSRKQPLHVLKIASGPGRSMYEWLSKHPDADIQFDCIDIDPAAIAYATDLNHAFLDRITISQKNVMKFRTQKRYDLIWAAGIFDYFNDAAFRYLLKRLLPALESDGEIVIGNFSTDNPSRPGMEMVGDWYLQHRTRDILFSLAKECGIHGADVEIGSEPEGINLFMHVACRTATTVAYNSTKETSHIG